MKPLLFLPSLLCMVTGIAYTQTPPSSPSAKWEAEIQAFEKEDQRNPPEKDGVLFVGSSSIRMWKSLEKDFPEIHVINRGFGGSQIEDSTYFIERIVLPYRPRMIVLYAGDNDLAAGKTPKRVFEDYKKFVRKVHQQLPKTRIAYISIKPSLARWNLVSKIKDANNRIRRYTLRDRRLAYIDVFKPMLGTDGQPCKELFVADGLHMTPAGYEVWKTVTAPYLTLPPPNDREN